MYADDVVLLPHDPLTGTGCDVGSYGLGGQGVWHDYQRRQPRLDAEIQVQQPAKGRLAVPVPEVKGPRTRWCGRCGEDQGGGETRAKGLTAFQSFSSFSNVWANKKLQLAHKMQVYHSYVVPCFLYGTEAGNWTAAHVSMLEQHTQGPVCAALMGVSRAERHTWQHIRTTCDSKPLELMLVQRTFRWLGHVMCMPDHLVRYPAMTFNCAPVGGQGGCGSGWPRGLCQ
jgi:hypothetical protein